MLGHLNKTLGDDEGLEPDLMPLKEWPRDDRNKTLKGILCLHYLTEEHKQEWRDWFHSLVEVKHSHTHTHLHTHTHFHSNPLPSLILMLNCLQLFRHPPLVLFSP